MRKGFLVGLLMTVVGVGVFGLLALTPNGSFQYVYTDPAVNFATYQVMVGSNNWQVAGNGFSLADFSHSYGSGSYFATKQYGVEIVNTGDYGIYIGSSSYVSSTNGYFLASATGTFNRININTSKTIYARSAPNSSGTVVGIIIRSAE